MWGIGVATQVAYNVSGDIYDKKYGRTSQFRQFLKFRNFQYGLILTPDIERPYENYP